MGANKSSKLVRYSSFGHSLFLAIFSFLFIIHAWFCDAHSIRTCIHVHHDVHFSSQEMFDRKLSLTVQLSDGDSYEGGRFEFDEVKTTADFTPKGSILVFPSYLAHKVHPVTSGRREALVAWFFGPRWR